MAGPGGLGAIINVHAQHARRTALISCAAKVGSAAIGNRSGKPDGRVERPFGGGKPRGHGREKGHQERLSFT